jgi:serine/threonine protein kinase
MNNSRYVAGGYCYLTSERRINMKSFSELARSVKFSNKGSKVLLNDKDPSLAFIGAGRSAFVFKINQTDKVLKVFFPAFEVIAKEEAEIYRLLSGTSYYPNLYESGHNYLVIDYIEGHTLFNCLEKGIPITKENIFEIDLALKVAQGKGLNPSDVHLRNIFLTPEGRIKMIDVARFRQTKSCTQWSDLKSAFFKLYNQKGCPKKIPAIFLNLIALLYKKNLLPSL